MKLVHLQILEELLSVRNVILDIIKTNRDNFNVNSAHLVLNKRLRDRINVINANQDFITQITTKYIVKNVI